MAELDRRSAIESLATIPPGQDVEIVGVLLRGGGNGDERIHLRPGRRWHCQYSGVATMLLVNHGGQTISISRDVARYVQVKRCPSTEHP